MMKYPRILMLIMLAGVLFCLIGCGSSSSTKGGATETGEVSLSQPLTSDTSLFPNSQLLAAIEDLLLNNTAGNLIASVTGEAVIIDTRPADAYASGHIPGAINAQWGDFVLWNDPPQKATLKAVAGLESQLGALGLTRDAWIVIYDDTVGSWGSAGRVFWMLEYLGCTHVQILNGGWDRWADQGLPSETTTRALPAAVFSAAPDATVNADKAYIESRRGADDFVIVDTRTDEEYMGWTLYDEARGGHLPDSVQLPYAWYYNVDKSILGYADLKTLFESHGITADKEVVAYCTAGVRSGFFYFLARLMGYERVANYDASIWDWAAADAQSYPMESYPNYQSLVYPAWVHALINGENPPTYSGNGYVIIEAMSNRGGDNTEAYDAGHIPGAIHLNIYALEGDYPNYPYRAPSAGNLMPDANLQAFVENLGITADTTVVIYGSALTQAGRTAWALMYAGVKDVRILNGGYNAWVAAGYESETTANTPSPVSFGMAVPANPEYLATTEDVRALELGSTCMLADIRRWEEFMGDAGSNTYLHFDDEGRIPGAVWAHNSDDYGNDDETFNTEMERWWKDLGIDAHKQVTFYCGTGWRSSLAFFYAHLLGFTDIKNYDGGFFEWSFDDTNEIEYGHTDRMIDSEALDVILQNDNDGQPYVIVETGWGAVGDKYNNGHIPGAIWVNTDEIEYDCFNPRNAWPVDAGDPACWDRSTTEEEDAAKGLGPDDALPRNWWNIYPDSYLLPAIAYMGIDKNTTVIVYSDSASAAARVIWTLMYAGVDDVRLLDGGKTAWTAAGYELETVANDRVPVASFDPDNPARVTAMHPEYKVDIPYVRDVVNGVESDSLLIDIRTRDEYIGASRPYSYIPTDGRVPGAIWGTDDYTNDDGRLKSLPEVYAFWNSQGITSDNHLSFYCGTAWRSSLAWFYGYMMGYPIISNFDSSWFEWSMGEGSAYAGADPVLNPIVDDEPGLP